MATIKAVSSKCGIDGILNYVTKEEKTEKKLLSGKNCQPASVKAEMQTTKELWGKTGGRTYKHFVQSFHRDEGITPEQAHQMAQEFADECLQFKGFEVFIATHKDRDHIHTHFIVNSVSYEDGHKFRMHKSELQQMKDLSDRICRQRGLHICEKGKTFEGAEREETSAYSKETYQLLKKAERGEVKSYVQDIALAVLTCREQAVSRQDFIQRMNDRGYGVDWRDTHKYITFTDLAREEQGEKQCKVRNNKLEKYYNMDFGREELERGFEVNARRNQTTERAREQLKSGIDRATKPDDRTAPTGNIGTFLHELEVDERASEEKRDHQISQRENREISRERQRAEAQRRAENAKREAEARQTYRRTSSRNRGIER